MEMISNIDRNQLTFSSLDEVIEKNNTVRVIDAFADNVDLKQTGFFNYIKIEGRQFYYLKNTTESILCCPSSP